VRRRQSEEMAVIPWAVIPCASRQPKGLPGAAPSSRGWVSWEWPPVAGHGQGMRIRYTGDAQKTVGSVTVDPSCDITCLEQRLGKARLVHEWDCSLSQSLLEVDARCTGQSLHRPSAQATQRAMYTYEHCYIAIYAVALWNLKTSVPAASPGRPQASSWAADGHPLAIPSLCPLLQGMGSNWSPSLARDGTHLLRVSPRVRGWPARAGYGRSYCASVAIFTEYLLATVQCRFIPCRPI
jgi:hypothetical protein